MTSLLTKFFPIPIPQFSLLCLLVFFAVHFPNKISVCLFLLALVVVFKHRALKRNVKLSCLLMLFATYVYITKSYQESQFRQEPTRIESVILVPDSVVINGDSLSFKARKGKNHFQIFYQLKNKKEQDFFKKNNQLLQISGSIEFKKAERKRYFNGFDYQDHLKNQGIYRIGHLKEIKSINVRKAESFFDYLAIWRRYAIVRSQVQFSKPMSDYMTGLLFGYLDKSFSEMTEIYSQLGIIHLFALSGMQVSFFLNLLRKGLILSWIPRDFYPILELCFSIIYAGLTGYSISVLRSLLQRNLANMGLKGSTNLCLTFLLMFLISPFFPLTIGGVLSFVYAFLLTLLPSENTSGLKGKILGLFYLQLATIPFLILFFSTFHPVSIILTLTFSFLFDIFILPLLTFIFLISPVLTGYHLNSLFQMLEKVMVNVVELFPHPIIFGQPPILVFLSLIFIVALIMAFANRKTYLLSFLIIYFFLLKTISIPFENEISIVDVGQGDSILLRDKTNKTLLIDVGGTVAFQGKEDWQKRSSNANAERTLIPYLKSRGIKEIDQLLLTHIDTDHVGDLEVVAKSFKIKEILVSEGSLTNSNFVHRLSKLGNPVTVLKVGNSIDIMNGKLYLIYPWKKGDGRNNDSLVLYGKLLNKSFLFTGDLEKEGEDAILRRYPSMKTDYLKVGHHGSKGSSSNDFLKVLKPKVAFISAGKDNRFHHPHKETLDRLIENHVEILRTDQEGTLRLTGTHQWRLERTNPNLDK
ncbi:DNA internalization-related competence protein ComEC/Rec2 [Streptococcus uberis]|uniref:DNA internalization-related competence protein ComEC/Rec2 n=1 Tax=Streptococcus uberis TaxID=1349 RepID=UPI000E1B7965|nr:DNA internalization-related competence protein ComEC/Rec2 [Streptococcus uberis]